MNELEHIKKDVEKIAAIVTDFQSSIDSPRFTKEFLDFFIGMEFNPAEDELIYIYAKENDIEEEHVRFRTIIGDVLVIEINDEGSGSWQVTFLPINTITDIMIYMSWDDLLKKKLKVKEELTNT